ncbi:MAG TPA: bacteriohopanetetrol glucosamine biosynthesis glycosyltransferase HpnI [Acidobacteriaceae bacterium]|nr:bacteriohopanetetrol glucosamine biosynthesis glycosyltransferase HpnI [Acidobacteriaceae bacterium]
MDTLALAAELVTALLTLCGLVYATLALFAARQFERAARLAPPPTAVFAPAISLLKPLKGVDVHLYAALSSHCTQDYPGPFELLFGVSSLSDPAVAEVARLRVEHPHLSIRLIECPARLGPNGKLSNLAQMLPHARHEHILINDADILVSPRYLSRVTAPFRDSLASREQNENPVGLVTAPYIGYASKTLWSRLEALGISTDFIPGVLTARSLEHGLRFGLGSTLATTKSALAKIGGFESLTDQLADDYELGARLHRAGFRIELIPEVVATSVPAYTLRSFCEHQLRWSRTVRDSRRAGYLGLAVTFVLPWALLTVLASGAALWSITLLSIALLARIAVALIVGVGVLGDAQVLTYIYLLPLRDCFGLFFWLWSYASNTVLWRGQRFRLHRGRLEPNS